MSNFLTAATSSGLPHSTGQFTPVAVFSRMKLPSLEPGYTNLPVPKLRIRAPPCPIPLHALVFK